MKPSFVTTQVNSKSVNPVADEHLHDGRFLASFPVVVVGVGQPLSQLIDVVKVVLVSKRYEAASDKPLDVGLGRDIATTWVLHHAGDISDFAGQLDELSEHRAILRSDA